MNGTDGYRIILTLELAVDLNQELLMKMHATIATGKLNKKTYREVCLNDTTGHHISSNRRLSDITHHGTSGVTNHGLTLAWDEFPTRIHSVETSPCPAASAPSIDVSESMDYMLPGNLQGFPSSTSTAFTSLERLLASIPQSQLVFNSPIKEVSGEYTFISATASSGPNTSTPADALNTSGDVLRVGDLVHSLESKHYTPQSSPSLPGHRNIDDLDDVEDSSSKCCNGEESQDHDEDIETDSAVTKAKAKVKCFKVPFVKDDVP